LRPPIRTAAGETLFSIEEPAPGNDAIREPASKEDSLMHRLRFTRAAAVILVLTFGLLPVAAQALPSELAAAGLRLEARDWLDHLAH
jgi:hypothetical protein